MVAPGYRLYCSRRAQLEVDAKVQLSVDVRRGPRMSVEVVGLDGGVSATVSPVRTAITRRSTSSSLLSRLSVAAAFHGPSYHMASLWVCRLVIYYRIATKQIKWLFTYREHQKNLPAILFLSSRPQTSKGAVSASQ